MMQQPEGDFVTTSADIVVAFLHLLTAAIICATLVYVLAVWTPKAARWLDKDCIIVEGDGK